MVNEFPDAGNSAELIAVIKQSVSNLEAELAELTSSKQSYDEPRIEQINPAIPNVEILNVVVRNLRTLVKSLKEFVDSHQWNEHNVVKFMPLLKENKFSSIFPDFLSNDLETQLTQNAELKAFCLKLINMILNLQLLTSLTQLTPDQITLIKSLTERYNAGNLTAEKFIEELKTNSLPIESVTKFLEFEFKSANWLTKFIGGSLASVDIDLFRNLFANYGNFAGLTSSAEDYADLLDLLTLAKGL